MKHLNILLGICASSFFLSTCSSDEGVSTNYPDPIQIELSNAELQMTGESRHFAAHLFSVVHELMANDPQSENIALSPLSLNMALAMVWNGANGETKQAIQQAMGMGDYPESEVNAYFKKLRESLIKTDPTAKLAIANSIWSRQGFPVKQSFYDTNRNYYSAEVNEVDFNSPNTPDLINQWCSDNTNGLIKEMIKKIPDEAVMYLLNALYFKGEWSDKFDPSATKDASFTKENGNSVRVKMMNQTNTLPYYRDKYLSAISLPFGNNAFSMVFILPDENVSFAEMLNQLKQEEYFAKCLQPYSQARINLFLPKFEIEYEIPLVKTLKRLGMGIAFSILEADFSNISDMRPLFISDAKQKTVISIDEKGAEAAVATAIEISYTSTPSTPTFRADRPFLFAIQENSTGVVLFMGKIGNPE